MAYKRNFIILNKEDDKYCEKGATGYCKIETHGDQANIKIFAQGLKKLEGGQKYKAHLISYAQNEITSAYIGEIEASKDKNELNIKVDAKNVMMSNQPISNFNIVAISVKDGGNYDTYQYPLVGYDKISKTSEWKSKLSQTNPKNIKTEKKNFDKIDKKNNIKEATRENGSDQNKVQQYNGDSYYEYLKTGNFARAIEIMKNTKGVLEFAPFSRSKLKYKWWKITNMRFLDDILINNLMASQIFKHPLIKKKIRENNYCLYGLVSDSNDNIKYMTFGFPSKYYTNDQIYIGGFSVFYPAEGFEKKNGDFGYWVVHIKIDNQNIVMTV